jgi:hypothetical protein
MKKKKILAIILVLLVVLLGGASVYVATQLNTRKSVAPTAPESKPAAADCSALTTQTTCDAQTVPDCTWYPTCNKCDSAGTATETVCPITWVGDAACTVTVAATDEACVPTEVITCNPDCPTACGTAASTITTCTNSCETATTKVCAATAACAKSVLEGSKTAYKNVTSNTPGVYALTSLMETVSKSQIYVYTVELTNTSETIASGVVIKDLLKDKPVVYMDGVAGCSFSAAEVELTCTTTVEANETKKISFRVRASDSIANGAVISNMAKVTYPDGSLDLTKDLAVSTIVGCNHTCTTNEECTTGLACDTTTGKCRKSACLTEDDCTCVTASAPTSRITAAAAPTTKVTTSPTRVATAAATPTILPETGIFDLPGIAAFGGGLLLAVIGILLAL